MREDRLNELLDAMPRIAKAVNSFDSPDVQSEAFATLMKAAFSDLPPEPRSLEDTDEHKPGSQAARSESPQTAAKKASTRGKTSAKKPNKKARLSAPPVDEALDIRPSDKISLPEFANKMNPTNMQNQSMVIIYWLKHHAGYEKIGISQIFTCYKKMGWKASPDLRKQLHNIAFKKTWLNTSDVEDVSLTITGEQHVEHDLTPEPAK